MRTFRIIGTAGVVATLLLPGVNAFAEEQASPVPTFVPTMSPTAVKREGSVPPVRVKLEKEKVTAERAKIVATTTRTKALNTEERKKMLVASTTAERIKAVRDEMNERIKEEREKGAERIAKIKDKQRQDKAQKLLSQFEELNKTWTDKFAAELDHLNSVLAKIQSRAAIAAVKGKDISAVTAAIQTAQSAIAAAGTAVTAQAAKTYTPGASPTPTAVTETTDGQDQLIRGLKEEYQTLHKALFADLFALRDGPMKLARRAVQDALAELKKVPGVDEETATSTTQTDQ